MLAVVMRQRNDHKYGANGMFLSKWCAKRMLIGSYNGSFTNVSLQTDTFWKTGQSWIVMSVMLNELQIHFAHISNDVKLSEEGNHHECLVTVGFSHLHYFNKPQHLDAYTNIPNLVRLQKWQLGFKLVWPGLGAFFVLQSTENKGCQNDSQHWKIKETNWSIWPFVQPQEGA